MIKIDNVSIYGWEQAIRGARNSWGSWDKSDSYFDMEEDPSPINPNDWLIVRLGPNDESLLTRLAKSGPDERKFMRMIVVYADITGPLYWWKQFDQYKVGTVSLSTSTMHSIHKKWFEESDFSVENLFDDPHNLYEGRREFGLYLNALNSARRSYLSTKDKRFWRQLIQLLPSSYNQLRTVMFNYEVLANIYHSRKNHKLSEWKEFCSWAETIPYSGLITGKDV